ncbi:MAG TPA: CapA family protein [Polyangiaceae bacterium]|jgi:poly-gamma-glutamate synthesis protein (capsule biosynthesis protein)|nr:CapA family protein [Polyangiaceae bacterium]
MPTTRRSLLALSVLFVAPTNSSAIELWIGGDVQLGDHGPLDLGSLSPLLAGATGMVNLEGPVGETDERALRLGNARSLLGSLRRAGIRAVGVANNHADDWGESGRTETLAALREEGLVPIGGAARIHELVISAHDLSEGVPSIDALTADVVTFHVTGPPSYLPRRELRQAVDHAVAAGARVVAAHGTHALGPVERRGDAVIAWGLGNLAFACDCTDEIDGALLRVSLAEEVRAWIVPIEAGLRGAAPRPARDPALIFDLLDALGSTPLRREGARAAF